MASGGRVFPHQSMKKGHFNIPWERAYVLGLLLFLFVTFAAARQPLPHQENPDLFQRIITLPEARLFERPSRSSTVLAEALPVFDLYYVFARTQAGDESWLEVGKTITGATSGWLPSSAVQDWSIMLVMQYAPPGQRERVLFFDRLDALKELVWSPRAAQEVQRLLAEVDAGRHKGLGLIAVEQIQKGQVTFDANPYLMPILDARHEEFDDGTQTTLIQVASITSGKSTGKVAERKLQDINPISQARRGILFVIDTTISMEPYIQRVRQMARHVYKELGKERLLERTSFGLVGYRNNMDEEPQRSGLEYVSRVYLPLDPTTPPQRFLESLDQMGVATVSTHAWDEDAVAGLHDAVWGTNWDPFDELRLVILITDAGALRADDPKARYYPEHLGLWNVRQRAESNDIVLLPIHLHTPEAKQAGDLESARRQYEELARTGDTNLSKYLAIHAGSADLFSRQLDTFAAELGDVVRRASRGIAEERPELQTMGGDITLGSLFRNEVFSAQQRYLGKIKGAEAVVFYRGWTADKDLIDPRLRSLGVNVFLTRNQLNELALGVDRLLKRARSAKDAPDTFFDLLRELSVRTATDPERYRPDFSTIAQSGLLPSYLAMLPYRSRVLALNPDRWRDLGPTGQNQLIRDLHSKLREYQDINEDRRKWKDLGGGDPGDEVYPIPLEYLP
jgi:serine/threonine-protein kinase PpkA